MPAPNLHLGRRLLAFPTGLLGLCGLALLGGLGRLLHSLWLCNLLGSLGWHVTLAAGNVRQASRGASHGTRQAHSHDHAHWGG